MIWAQSISGVIARSGTIPWRLPEDQERFKELTLNRTVVMGRLTWESLPDSVRPLPQRENIVLTRNPDYRVPGARVVSNMSQVPLDDAWVIGGAHVYAAALPLAQRCEVTEVDVDLNPQDGDVLAPELGNKWSVTTGDWRVSSTGLRYRYLTYTRRPRRFALPPVFDRMNDIPYRWAGSKDTPGDCSGLGLANATESSERRKRDTIRR